MQLLICTSTVFFSDGFHAQTPNSYFLVSCHFHVLLATEIIPAQNCCVQTTCWHYLRTPGRN
jgi:hypothetical protein